VESPVGGFAIDGNLGANTPDAGLGDWLLLNTSPGAGGAVLDAAGKPLNPLTTFHFIDAYNGKDIVFAGGQKWFDNPTNWVWTVNKASSKTDINNVLLHVTRDVDGHTWVVIAADRFSTSGDSYIDFEFLQSTLVRNANGGFSSAGPQGGRTVGDLVLSLAFTGGGSIPDFLAYRWQGSGPYSYVDVTGSLPVGRVFVALNTNTIAVPYGAFGQTTYAPNAFAEAALDLTALLGSFDECLSIGFKTIMVKTKASPSDTATIGDLIDPIQYPFRIGPSVDAGSDQTRCTEGSFTTFPLTGAATSGTKPIASTTWSVVAGTATIDSSNSLATVAQVFSPTAVLRLTAVQANGCTEVDDILLTVSPLPVASISGPAFTCPASSTQFRAPPGMSAYSWSIAGNGTLTGSTTQQTVTVTSGNLCGQEFTLTLNVTSNKCSDTSASIVMVNDTTPPTLVCPADKVLECPADTRTNATGVATAQDDCGVANLFYADIVNNECAGTKTILRTWTAIDRCGNTNALVQTITVRDTLKPVLQCPANRTVECGADTSTTAMGVATAQDGCGAVTISYADAVSNQCGGTKVISRTWTALDGCGNSASGVQTITVQDTTKPTIQVPANKVLECGDDTSPNATGAATAQDLCGQASVRYSDVVSNKCGFTKVILRTWTATDECGNTNSGVQTITVQDTIKPTLQCPPDKVLDCPAATGTNVTGVATAQDTCGQVTLRYTDVVTNQCTGARVILRTWTATDECGNSTSATQTITVKDTTKPVLTLPSNRVLQAPADTSTNATGVATATDTCSPATVRYSDVVTAHCGSTKSIARTWTATDECGNAATGVQTITVEDTTPPTLTCPADKTLECPGDTRTNVTGVATASDAAGAVTMSYADSVTNQCAGTKIVFRTWTAVDACGNTTARVQTITVRDTLKPVIQSPADRTVECGADTSTAAMGVATAQDGCSAATISYADGVSNKCGGTKVISRVWTAVDQCGNSASTVQTITVQDTTKPTLQVPANKLLQCGDDTSTNATGVATAQDVCGQASVRYSDIVSNKCGFTKVILRTWTATDECGNTNAGVQTITVQDTIKPTLQCPPDKVLECPAATGTNVTGVATAQDTCGQVTIQYTDVVTNQCTGARVILRTWTATDECGNSTSATQTITVKDSTKPLLTLPSNRVLQAPADTSTNATGVATATDTCSPATVRYSDVVTARCGSTKSIARTWTATDECGNVATGVQTITVEDTTPPTLACPADKTLECPGDTRTNVTGVATASDTAGAVTISYADTVQSNCGATKVIKRTWTATDECGNRQSCVQTLTVVDTVKPIVSLPSDRVVECGASTLPSATGTATAQDGCSQVTITYSDSVLTNCGGSKVITRTWTVADACGNSTNGVQVITVRDTTAPTLRLPANLTQQCPGDTRTNVTGVPTVTEGCSSVIVSYSDTVSNGCGLTRTVLRLWTATDQCGNSTNALQTISVIDTTKPSLSLPTIRVQCGTDVPAPYADLAAFRLAGGTATDGCSPTLSFSLVSDSGLVGRCPGQVTRVYRLTDVCGNVAEGTQTITVDDTIAPVMVCVSNVTVECGASLEPASTGRPTATDNCATNVLISYSDATVPANYDLKFYVADPDSGTGPYSPTYLKFGPGTLPCPEGARLTGRALDPLRNAVAYAPGGQLDALTSIGNVPLAFGQIVPFETVIQVSGGVGPERGTLEFTAAWSTYTTSNNRFGYDTNYMVYCAFVDAADPGSIDPNQNARVESYSAVVINPGTIEERIQGTFRVSGLDSGDRVVVEIWVVLMSEMPGHTGGTVAADLVAAQTAAVPPVSISIGTQTDSLGNLGKIGILPPPQQQPPLGPLPPQPPALPGGMVSLINRAWTARDDCGNSSQCVQTITVRDATAPTLVCPLDRSVMEGEAWTFEQPVATDGCGTVTVRILGTTTNLTSESSSLVTRLWGAYDQSGNSATCQQTVTIQKPAAPLPPPALQIRLVDPTHVELSWVAPSTGFALEVTDPSLPGSWSVVSATPVVLNGRNVVVVPSSSIARFYRLRKGQ
jgi:hypothetical protein